MRARLEEAEDRYADVIEVYKQATFANAQASVDRTARGACPVVRIPNARTFVHIAAKRRDADSPWWTCSSACDGSSRALKSASVPPPRRHQCPNPSHHPTITRPATSASGRRLQHPRPRPGTARCWLTAAERWTAHPGGCRSSTRLSRRMLPPMLTLGQQPRKRRAPHLRRGSHARRNHGKHGKGRMVAATLRVTETEVQGRAGPGDGGLGCAVRGPRLMARFNAAIEALHLEQREPAGDAGCATDADDLASIARWDVVRANRQLRQGAPS